MLIRLSEKLVDWTDIDIAAHELAIILGVVDESRESFQKEFKWLYWSDNQYGKLLYRMINDLVLIDFLEFDEEEQRVRSNKDLEIIKPPPIS